MHQEAIATKARSCLVARPFAGDVYARIVWFHRDWSQEGDADNISKPIVDALNGIFYDDDRKVVKRLVHKVCTRSEAFVVDSANAPKVAYDELVQLLAEDHPHIIYVEVGLVRGAFVALGPIDGG